MSSGVRKATTTLVAVLLASSMAAARPTLANVYSPPWSDSMWGHYPDGLNTETFAGRMKTGSNDLGYSGFSSDPSSVPATMGASFAQSDAIWMLAGHGEAGVMWSVNTYGTIGALFVSSGTPGFSYCSAPNDCLTDYTSTQMHRIRLMIFAGCNTADAIPNGDRLHKRAHVNLGADSTMAFSDLIYFGGYPDIWPSQFTYFAANHNVLDSASSAASVLFAGSGGNSYGYNLYSIYGSNVMINPPAYGS